MSGKEIKVIIETTAKQDVTPLLDDASGSLEKVVGDGAQIASKCGANHLANESGLTSNLEGFNPDNAVADAGTLGQQATTAADDSVAAPANSRIANILDPGHDEEPAVDAPTPEEPSGPVTDPGAPEGGGPAGPPPVGPGPEGPPPQDPPTPSAPDPSAPQYDRNALSSDTDSYGQEIDKALAEHPELNMDRATYDQLRVSPTNDMTDAQVHGLVTVRNSIPIKGKLLTKVIKPEIMEKYMSNGRDLAPDDRFNPNMFGNSIARGADTADLVTPQQLRNGLSLDDGFPAGSPKSWTPIPEGATEAYQLRMPAPDNMQAGVSFGAVRPTFDDSVPTQDVAAQTADAQAAADRVATAAGQSGDGTLLTAPFTGTGYTEGGIPEWQAGFTEFGGRAEMWKVTADGQESMVGYYDPDLREWTPTNA